MFEPSALTGRRLDNLRAAILLDFGAIVQPEDLFAARQCCQKRSGDCDP